MGINTSEIFTATIKNSQYTISTSMSFRSFSIVLGSGVGYMIGSLSVLGVASTAIDLAVGQAINITAADTSILGEITIDTSAGGVVYLIARL